MADARPGLSALFDLLGARLHFEAAGVQLYDALLAKRDGQRGFAGGPTTAELVEIRNEERLHVRMLSTLIAELGGDPATMTPAATRELNASRGLIDVVVDPTMSLLDGLEAMVVAELADHEQWVGLVEAARELERDDLARTFASAQTTEHEHLSKIRSWISAGRAANRNEVSDATQTQS
jgi:rubrerythrin